MLGGINLLTKVRVSEAHEDAGLDESLHGEKAYAEGAMQLKNYFLSNNKRLPFLDSSNVPSL